MFLRTSSHHENLIYTIFCTIAVEIIASFEKSTPTAYSNYEGFHENLLCCLSGISPDTRSLNQGPSKGPFDNRAVLYWRA